MAAWHGIEIAEFMVKGYSRVGSWSKVGSSNPRATEFQVPWSSGGLQCRLIFKAPLARHHVRHPSRPTGIACLLTFISPSFHLQSTFVHSTFISLSLHLHSTSILPSLFVPLFQVAPKVPPSPQHTRPHSTTPAHTCPNPSLVPY